MINTVAKEWERCAAMMFEGLNPSPIQQAEMQKAFYAGAWLMLQNVKQLGEPQYSEEQGAKHLQMLEDEVATFVVNMLREYPERN